MKTGTPTIIAGSSMMATCSIYLRKEKVIIPTASETDAGFYIEIEPVTAVDARDAEAVMRAVVAKKA